MVSFGHHCGKLQINLPLSERYFYRIIIESFFFLQNFLCICLYPYKSGPGCSKLTTSLVNVSLKFQTLIFEICNIFAEKM